MGQHVQNPDGSYSQQVSLTGRNVQKDGRLKVNSSVGELAQPTVLSAAIAPPVGGSRRPKWRDKNGVLWATFSSNKIQKSTDNGQTWVDVLTITGGDIMGCGLMVADDGRIIVGEFTGKQVLISDTAQTTYSQAFAFGNQSYFNQQMAHVMYDNIVAIGSYDATATGVNARNEVWLSKDYGATWNKVFTAPILNSAHNCHIHDIEYDPWDKRLWILTGDNDNKNIFYSDDFGATWTTVFPSVSHPKNQQPAQIIAFQHGVIFGSDSGYQGLHYWPKNGVVQAPVDPNDIILDFYPFKPQGTLKHFACRKWVVRHKDMQLALMPFCRDFSGGVADGYARILASQDGLKWYEIYKHMDSNDAGFRNIIGPHPNDPQRRIMAMFYKADNTWNIFTAQVPEFISEFNNKRSVQVESSPLEVVYINATTSGDVVTATTEFVDIKPPEGYVYEIESISIDVDAPVGATTGTQEISVRKGTNSSPTLLYATYAYNTKVNYNMGEFQGSTTALPSDKGSQAANIKGVIVSPTQFLRIAYTNKSGVTQSNARNYHINAKKIKVNY